MSWLFSRALVAGYLPGTCSDGEPSAPSSSTPTPAAFYWPDKTTEHSRLSQFGMTSEPLTEKFGKAVLMSYRAVFHAKTLVPQGKAKVSMESEAASGRRWLGSFAKYDPATSTWRTPQCSLLGGLDVFSETWPRWGSMRSGESFLRPIPALPTCESASGLWQTPVADDAIERKAGKWNSRGEPKLSAEVLLRRWPTPMANDAEKRGAARVGACLPRAVQQPNEAGLLNPDWVEWLMGWPIGWTDLKPLATDRFREWRQQHGAS